MRRRLITARLLFVMVMTAVPFVGELTGGGFGTYEAEAATAYKKLHWTGSNQWKKVGSYYFKQSSGKILFSKSTTSGAKKAAFKGKVYGDIVTNGKYIYAIELVNEETYRFSRCRISDNSVKTIKTYSTDGGTDFYIAGFYGNAILIQREEIMGYGKVYTYNISTKKYKLAASKCWILSKSGRYLIGSNDEHTDAPTRKTSLYKVSKAGTITKIKTLGSYIGEAKIIDEKVYYVNILEVSGTKSKVNIYSCNLDGTGTKQLGSLQFMHDEWAPPHIPKLTSKSCTIEVYDYGTYTWRYTYKTKELTWVK